MKEITGVLAMLGSGSTVQNGVGKSFVRYDTVEIGDRVVQKVRTARSLSDFISRGLGQVVTLYFVGNMIVGVKLPENKVYFWKRSWALVVYCLVLLPLWGMGLLVALLCKDDLEHIIMVQPKLARMGGVALRS